VAQAIAAAAFMLNPYCYSLIIEVIFYLKI